MIHGSEITPSELKVGDKFTATISHYCACSICCGYKTEFITAGGTVVWNGMDNPYIVANNSLPIGSQIYVNGELYTVMDKGGSLLGNSTTIGRFDIFTPEGHEAAIEKGIIPNSIIEIVRLGKY